MFKENQRLNTRLITAFLSLYTREREREREILLERIKIRG
jgi:hypothetical protein